MDQWENESLEDYEEKIQLSYKRAHSCTFDHNSFKIVFLKGVRKEFTKTLNIFENEDIF